MSDRRRPQTLVDRAIAASINRPIPTVAGYPLATLAVLGTALFRAMFVTQLLPWLLHVPVVLACALALGTRPAIWATFVAAAAAGFSIFQPGNPLLLSGPQWSATFVFIAVGFIMVFLGGQLRRAFARAEAVTLDYQKALELAEARGDRLAEREGFLSGVLESSSDCIKVLDLDGGLRFMSEGGMRVMEVADFGTISGCPWPGLWEGEERDLAQAAVEAAKRGEASAFTGRGATLAGNMRWWDVAVSPILDAAGKPERILSVSRDVTRTRQADDQVRLLNRELGHRLKNTLALVQAIVAQTLKGDIALPTARDALIDRLVALGRGADMLTAGSWEPAELETITRSVLSPYIDDAGRMSIEGPTVQLSSRLALSMALALHELATNAVKYGALSSDSGRVEITWEISPDAGADEDALRFTWRESGGPTVAEPTRKGFGSFLIGRALNANFRGRTHIDYPPQGVTFQLVAPVSALNEVERG